MTEDVQAALSLCSTTSANLKKISDNIDAAKQAEFESLRTQAGEIARGSLQVAVANAIEQFEAVEYGLKLVREQKVSQENQVRYRRTKIVNRMCLGGFGNKFAKAAVPMLEAPIAASTGDFDPETVMFWQADHSIAKAVAAAMVSSPNIGEKKKSLSAALQKHTDWQGCMSALEAVEQTLKVFPEQCKAEHVDSEGARPWLCAVKLFRERIGPTTWPMPGLGAFIAASQDNDSALEIGVMALKVEELLKQGISLPDMAAYFESPAGVKLLAETSIVLQLRAGEAAWIPYGWVAVPVVWEVPAGKQKPCEEGGDGKSEDKTEEGKDKAGTTEKADDAKKDNSLGLLLRVHMLLFCPCCQAASCHMDSNSFLVP